MANNKDDVQHIEGLFPNATHANRMKYAQQEPIGDVSTVEISVSDTHNTSYIESLYPNATHAYRMQYTQQDAIGDIVQQQSVQHESVDIVGSSTVTSDTTLDNTSYIESLYPNATHACRMQYTQQDAIGDIVQHQSIQCENVKNAETALVVENIDNIDYIEGLYPNATHASRMTYVPQSPIGGIVQHTPTHIEIDDKCNTDARTHQATQNVTDNVNNSVKMSQSVIATNIVTGTVVEGIGGEVPLSKGVLYAGSKVARDAMGINDAINATSNNETLSPVVSSPSSPVTNGTGCVVATNIVVGTVVEGIGGESPLSGAVLYAGSQVARDAMGVYDAVSITSNNEALNPVVSSPVTNGIGCVVATNIVAGTVIEGVGGESPLSGAVLYAGSQVARDAMGVIDTPVTTVSSNCAGATVTPSMVSAPYGVGTPVSSVDENVDDGAYDVLIVGGGPSGLASAIRIKQMAKQSGKDVSVCLVEKGSQIGSHIMSGAVLETRALDELLPNWSELGAPLDTPAKADDFLFLTKNKSFKMPTPPQMHNKGNYIISLGKFCNWMGGIAEDMGVEIYTGTSAVEVLKENDRVVGIRTGAFGVDKNGENTPNYAEGMELRATYTIMGEGCRGHLTKGLFEDYALRENSDPQTFGIGIKELWEVPAEQSQPGKIVHTTGWPMDSETYGGSFLYHLEGNQVAVGFVIGLDYKNPHLFPYMEFQRFKHHPSIAKHLQGGRRISYGARAINEGGYQSIPSLVFKGGMLIGCTAGFLNVPKIKGTHTAMKSGMIAGEEVYKALQLDEPVETLESYPQALEQSWVYQELHKVRNIRPSFHKFKFWGGLVYSALTTYVFRGKEPWTFKNHDDHSQLGKAKEYKKIDYPAPDGVLSFDRLTNVAFSGTAHEENQPCHLTLRDAAIPITVNLKDYDMPETRYCPAGVYELIEKDGAPALQINAQNCVHCKTCDIKDPCQNINWIVPEGGAGPNYQGM